MLYNDGMKKYPFKFSKLMYAVFIAGIILCLAGAGVTLYRIFAGVVTDTYDWIGVSVMTVIILFLLVLIVSLFFKAQYEIHEDKIVLQLGILRNTYPLTDVTSVHLFKGANKLAIYFKDERYAAIVIASDLYDDFMKTLMERNEKIGFSFSSPEEEDGIK